ncbi:MAG TPA: benzoylformate decarboxylase [Microbacterium sp.]|nr:benzoylformate decarboxylase [Microbacterium sp.]
MSQDNARPPVAHDFYEILRTHGITRIFGNPGSNELTMLKHLPDDIEYVLALQEGAALAMAEGYAYASGTVGFVNLHSGSGAGNAMGNLTNSAAAHAPLVVLAGQQSRKYMPYGAMLASNDPVKLYDPLVKWSGEPLRPEDTAVLTSKAILLAATAPTGPVFLSVPLDDWEREGDPETVAHLIDRRVMGAPVIDTDSLEVIAAALAGATNPVMVLGPGVDNDRGWQASVRLADSREMPVWIAPSPSRAPFPTRHGRFQGLLPTGLGAIAEKLAGHDLVLTLGAAVFRYHQFIDGPLIPDGAQLVGVTSDPDEATRAGVGTILVGDPSDALVRLAEVFATDDPAILPARTVEPATAGDAPYTAEAILDAVDRSKPVDARVVLEWTSADAMWPRLSFERSGSYFFPASGGLGWGLPAAIGLAMGSPERPVVALIGDGAMQYTPAALWTAARYKVPVTFVVCQNREYGALQRFARHMEVPDAPYLDIPDLDPTAIATGYGVPAVALDSLHALEEFVRSAATAEGPRLAVIPQRSAR